MDSDNRNYENMYCPEDDEYRAYWENCDKFCIERYYENHLKSQTHTNNFCKRQRLK